MNYDEKIRQLEARKRAKEEQRAAEAETITAWLNGFVPTLSQPSRKELNPAIKRLDMFVRGEKYTHKRKED